MTNDLAVSVKAVLSLGSNIDKEQNLPSAIAMLRDRLTVLAVSFVYETQPVGLIEQESFWNCAVLIETRSSAETLKATVIQEVETLLNRQRTDDKNAPRTIDVDLALYGDRAFTYAGRPIPDPDILKFAHVAVPIADLLGEHMHPLTGESFRMIANRITQESGQTIERASIIL